MPLMNDTIYSLLYEVKLGGAFFTQAKLYQAVTLSSLLVQNVVD